MNNSDAPQIGEGELCDGKYYVTTIYGERWGRFDSHVCAVRHALKDSSVILEKCCLLDECPVVSGTSLEYMDNALRAEKAERVELESNIIYIA